MLRLAFLIGMLLTACVATAQNHISDFDDSVRLEYQYTRTSQYNTGTDSLDFGKADTHFFLLSGVWSIN